MKSKNSGITSTVLNNRKCITECTTIVNVLNDFFHSAATSFLVKNLVIIFLEEL